MSGVRVRLAPSPTGNLHVGTARTGLYNYLFAKHHVGGKFILRIEDTDLERSEAKYVQDIYDGLRLLGLAWDEGPDIGGPYGPYVQSERLDIYAEYATRLLQSGHAYHCYCTPEELDVEKALAAEEKRNYLYSRRCCEPDVAARFQQEGVRMPVVRFRVPAEPESIVLEDEIRGTVTFETALIGDFVLMKSNGLPSYNFAVVVDDITMKITHVIRGEDHVSNTPKQILLYSALGEPLPVFAHVSMILAPDRSKLSKRHGATAVAEFVRTGYLPEACTNFLTMLGWSPPDGREVDTLESFAAEFTLGRISSSPAVFDQEKLNWINGHYIRHLPLPNLLERVRPFLQEFDLAQYPEEKLLLMLEAVREPITVLNQLPQAVSYFFGKEVHYSEEIQADVLRSEETLEVLQRFEKELLPTLPMDDPEAISQQVKEFANSLKPVKMKTIMWAIRAATTGRTHGADLGKTLYILGKDTVTFRVEQALKTVSCQSL